MAEAILPQQQPARLIARARLIDLDRWRKDAWIGPACEEEIRQRLREEKYRDLAARTPVQEVDRGQ